MKPTKKILHPVNNYGIYRVKWIGQYKRWQLSKTRRRSLPWECTLIKKDAVMARDRKNN
jgi:hypothetical protein